MMTFEKIVNVTPAFDKRSSDPAKNHGIGACRIWFILKGPLGAVQFQIGTDWYLPANQQELKSKRSTWDEIQPTGWDVGYHSPKPMYEGQSSMKCDLMGGECYYDGSSIRADEWVPKFLAGGTEWLWKELEEEYRYRFESKESEAA